MQCRGPLGYRGRPSVVRDTEESGAMPWTTRLSGQAISGEGHRKDMCNAVDHSAIGHVLLVELADCEYYWVSPQLGTAVLQNCSRLTLVHSDFYLPISHFDFFLPTRGSRAALNIEPWLSYQGRPSVVRDSEQPVAMLWTTQLSGHASIMFTGTNDSFRTNLPYRASSK